MAPIRCGRWSAGAGSCSASREEPVQEPAGFALIEPGTEEPEPPSLLVLNAVVVAQFLSFCAAAPPFAQNALRPFGTAHAVLPPAPAEEGRRIVRHWCHGNDRLGPPQQAHRPPPREIPAGAGERHQHRRWARRPLRDMALLRQEAAQ